MGRVFRCLASEWISECRPKALLNCHCMFFSSTNFTSESNWTRKPIIRYNNRDINQMQLLRSIKFPVGERGRKEETKIGRGRFDKGNVVCGASEGDLGRGGTASILPCTRRRRARKEHNFPRFSFSIWTNLKVCKLTPPLLRFIHCQNPCPNV